MVELSDRVILTEKDLNAMKEITLKTNKSLIIEKNLYCLRFMRPNSSEHHLLSYLKDNSSEFEYVKSDIIQRNFVLNNKSCSVDTFFKNMCKHGYLTRKKYTGEFSYFYAITQDGRNALDMLNEMQNNNRTNVYYLNENYLSKRTTMFVEEYNMIAYFSENGWVASGQTLEHIIKIVINENIFKKGDEKLIEQVLDNLVYNDYPVFGTYTVYNEVTKKDVRYYHLEKNLFKNFISLKLDSDSKQTCANHYANLEKTIHHKTIQERFPYKKLTYKIVGVYKKSAEEEKVEQLKEKAKAKAKKVEEMKIAKAEEKAKAKAEKAEKRAVAKAEKEVPEPIEPEAIEIPEVPEADFGKTECDTIALDSTVENTLSAIEIAINSINSEISKYNDMISMNEEIITNCNTKMQEIKTVIDSEQENYNNEELIMNEAIAMNKKYQEVIDSFSEKINFNKPNC
jgi:hypothetical protein